VGRLIRGAVGLGVAALVVLVVGPAPLLERLEGAKPGWFAAAVAVAALANLLSALRWTQIARALGLAARQRDLVVFYFRGVTTNSVLPGAHIGGDVLRAMQLHRSGNPLTASVSSVVIDRLLGFWTQAAVSLVAFGVATLSGQALLPAGLAAGYVVVLLVVLALPALPLSFFSRSRLRAVAHAGEALLRWQRFTRERPRGFFRLAAAAVLVALGWSTVLWLCLRAIGADAPYLAVLGLACGVFAGAAVPLALAGFGPREVAAVLFLSALAPGAAAAAAASVLYGLAATVQGIAAAPLFALHVGEARPGSNPPEARSGP